MQRIKLSNERMDAVLARAYRSPFDGQRVIEQPSCEMQRIKLSNERMDAVLIELAKFIEK